MGGKERRKPGKPGSPCTHLAGCPIGPMHDLHGGPPERAVQGIITKIPAIKVLCHMAAPPDAPWGCPHPDFPSRELTGKLK